MSTGGQLTFLSCVRLAGFLAAATDDVPVLTVCEALNDPQRFDGKSVVIVGRFSFTDEGSWLDENCGLKVVAGGREFQPSVSTSYSASDFDAPPQKPSGFMWDEHLLQQKLKQVKQTTRLRDSDQWLAIFGRLETHLPRRVSIRNGRYGYTSGFGHSSAAPAQLVSPTDGSHPLDRKGP